MQHNINLDLSEITLRQKFALQSYAKSNWTMFKACLNDMEEEGDCEEAWETEQMVRFFWALRRICRDVV